MYAAKLPTGGAPGSLQFVAAPEFETVQSVAFRPVPHDPATVRPEVVHPDSVPVSKPPFTINSAA